MDFRLISYLSFLIAFQLLFVGIFLITNKKGNRRNNILFAFLFILIAWNMADLTLQMNGVNLKWDFLQQIDDSFFLLYGPIIYIYVNGVIFKDFNWSPGTLLHLLPYILITVTLLSYREHIPAVSEDILQSNMPWQFYLIGSAMYVHFFIYLGLSYRALWKYRHVIRNKYSQIDQINLDWLSFSLNTFGLITLLSLVHNFISLAKNMSVFIISLILLLLFVFYFVIKVILKAIQQPEIFKGIGKNETAKYKGSRLTQDQIDTYKKQLLEMLHSEKPFMNSGITLSDLSDKLSVSTKDLSQVINQSFNKSFFDFINSFRVREAQRIFKGSHDLKLTVLEVMYEVGFNSKSSFNTAFKKETGQTPTEFRKKL